jgi:hypothetical protein
VVARDEKVTFNETALYQTPKGDLVALMRTADFNDHTAVTRSVDGGKSFQPWQDAGFHGHPHYALRLPDRRVLLVYGYRHRPFGIRARAGLKCTNVASAEEIVLPRRGKWRFGLSLGHDDVRNRPWWFITSTSGDGTRHIAGTIPSLASAGSSTGNDLKPLWSDA